MVQTIWFSFKYLNDYVTTTVSSSTNTTMSDQYDTKMHDPVVNMVNVETIS